VEDFEQSRVDWDHYSLTDGPAALPFRERKQLRPHQATAIADVTAGFAAADRGQMVMACGTGKTFTSLRLAEQLVGSGGTVLFLVPSINLLSQSVLAWAADAGVPLASFAVCSDAQAGRKADEDMSANDLAIPASTDVESLLRTFRARSGPERMSVVFSTYQSIDVITEAQAEGLPRFDLIVCDEAHRTTGVTLADQDESHFVKIHDNKYIRAAKRLYMTATPRVYGDETKSKAGEADATLCSMDDEALYGPEFHRLGFGESVEKNLLSDYKVLVLAVDEAYAAKTFQAQITDSDNSLNLDDAVRITGCWNGLAKKLDHTTTDEAELYGDLAPMRTAVAFSRSIANSKAFCEYFTELVAAYKKDHPDEENLLDIECDHVDGGMNAIVRHHKLDWLKEPGPALRCRILSNARCLSEGVDVPSLDAVMFLNPRNSVVDVVQSVGRVMRKSTNKQYGYIILPIGIPAGVTPEEALKDNKKYAVVWQVLQALRSHDDRFDAFVNKLDLIGRDPRKMEVIAITDKVAKKPSKTPGPKNKDAGKGGFTIGEPVPGYAPQQQAALPFEIGEIERAIYAKLVQKCGNRHHWEDWANDIAKIARTHIDRITAIVADPANQTERDAFHAFAAELRDDLNGSITDGEVIEMLAQHLITKPVFDALFADYSFAKHNPMSLAMQGVLDVLQEHRLDKEAGTLQKFYDSVKMRAEGIDSAAGKQKIVVELYDKFFRNAFLYNAAPLSDIYTPVEVVDFIIHS
ncbi:MAG: DEAD/DEAH box helicase, partial [Verrucomicrobiae bacterium]|nr:DEAD/DEAH box helicase [Verrucomicrobiae bacterium]